MDRSSLPTDVATLQRLLLESRRDLGVSQEKAAELSKTVETQRSQLEASRLTIRELLQALRGKQRERIDPNQLLLFELGELTSLAEEAADDETSPAKRKRKKRHGRQVIPDEAPREERIIELPETERLCPHDGQPMPLIRYETSEQLEYVPPSVKVIVFKRAVYACPEKHDEATLLTAPKPPQPIEKGLAGPGLLAAMAVGKFGDHLPGYRLEDILSRHQIEIRRTTIYGWLSAVADLVGPLVGLMKQRVLQSKLIHTDDTKVKLIDKAIRSTREARFWAYLGDRENPYTVYDFTQTRERAGPQAFLEGYQGYLQADAYGGYDGIYLKSKGAIKEVACWAHCRRYWWKAREHAPESAHHVLGVINQLYQIERKTVEPTERLELRRRSAVPILDALERWLAKQTFLPKSQIGKAAKYTRNQWEALRRYTDDGDLAIDNNAAERAMKNIALGRKAWLFVGSPVAGARAANLISLIASCKENRVEPWAYMRDVFTRIPLGVDLETLLPDVWLKHHPNHRWTIADQREQERNAKS